MQSEKLTEYGIQLLLHSSPLFVVPSKCFVGFRQRIGRYDEPYATRFAKPQNFFTTGILLLYQGEFKYKVGLDVDVHATASYSTRPSCMAVRNPDLASQPWSSGYLSVVPTGRIISPSHAATSNSKA